MPSSSDCDCMGKESLLDVISQDEIALEHGGLFVQHNWRVLRRREETRGQRHRRENTMRLWRQMSVMHSQAKDCL